MPLMLGTEQIFYNFCQSVGHDEHNYRSYELMMDRTPTYRVQEEMWLLDQGTGGAQGKYHGCG